MLGGERGAWQRSEDLQNRPCFVLELNGAHSGFSSLETSDGEARRLDVNQGISRGSL